MLKSLGEIDVRGKRVLLRCDFNVPLDERGEILDDFRIKAALPTINYLVKEKAKVILMSHLDDPEGKIVERLRLDKIQEKLMEYLDLSVVKAPDCLGEEIEQWSKEMQPGEILLLENLRFHKEEEENEQNFAKELSRLGDIYINEAFSVCHRAHASIVGLPKFLRSGAGFLLKKEIETLGNLMKNPKKPLVSIIGGKKVETKVKLIDEISKISDFVLIGGLLKREIKEKGIILEQPQRIIEPVDIVLKKESPFDLNIQTLKIFKEKIKIAKTIFWNGPLGKVEEKQYSFGTEEIAEAIIESRAFSIVGGGETVEFLNKIGLLEKFSYVSTGGGAMLSFLSGEKLIGLEALKRDTNYKSAHEFTNFTYR